MRSEWTEFPLSELATFRYGKFLPKAALQERGYPVFSGYGIVGFLPDFQFKEPQLLIVCRGEGGTGDVKMSPATCSITNLSIVISPKESRVVRSFLYWALKAGDTHRLRTGSAQAQIVIGALEKFPVSIPSSLDTQRSIASVLDALDARIALLHRTNTTFEKIVQALFKSWFIDFDPVHAKADGREPEGVNAATAALFPTEFEESVLGLIPKGWQVGRLGDVLRQRVERTKPSDETAATPYVPIECISSKSVFLTEFFPGEQARSSLSLFRKGDVLFGAMRPYFHKVCLAPFDGVTRTTAFVLQPDARYRAFALFAAFHDSTIEYATTHSEGSTIPYAKWTGSLENKALVIPPAAIAAAFEAIVAPLLDAGIHNTERAKGLADARDALVPRLMTGKLRLPEAEDQIEEAIA